ncbi:MAG: hypothetical protein EPO51_26950 [Phenylobacterium sp.]|uniref:hypothetical protein n=1 Tax=Phenylobacterium sp. TaxID=1871053 RepID=UPI0011F52755|nr:hypothetical protein [Phenylobacterium sp.]TAJ68526.1 MAG: hypothetical protein EPO51_26950 [Phenylobacterium sp.]
MSADTLLGVLAIVAFSLAGFAALSAGGLIGRLPPRARRVVTAVGWAVYALFLSGMVYRSLLMERGLVERGHLSQAAGLAAWAAVSLVLGILTVRRIARTLSQTDHHTGTGASA